MAFQLGSCVGPYRIVRELGRGGMGAARISVRYNSNVSYYTVRPKVTVDQIKSKVVF